MNKTDDMINKHIASVQLRMEGLSMELEKRGMTHDKSKLEEPEHSLWTFIDKDSSKPKYGTSEYEEKKKRFKSIFEMHYKDPRNRHHPEHWENGINDMNIIDIIEMLCDWISYKDNLSYADASKIIKENCERFNIDEQLANILINTLNDYFASFFDEGEPAYIKNIKSKIQLT